MKIIPLDYTTFWTLISSKTLLAQYIDTGDCYQVFALESSISWETFIPKDGGANQTDFETNHKTSCNQPLEIKAAAGRPLRVSASPQPLNTVEHWKGYQLVLPAGQLSAYVDVSFSSTVYLHGGYIVSADVDFDDYIQADVLVAANNAEYIPGIVSNAYMIPNLPVSFESAESMVFPTSVKIRVTLTTADANATDVHANILVDYFI
jgi:hypothetical protein